MVSCREDGKPLGSWHFRKDGTGKFREKDGWKEIQ